VTAFASRLARNTVLNRSVQIAVALWAALNVAAILLAHGHLPFDRPALVGKPFAFQMALPTVGLLEVFLLMAVTYWLTSRRAIPDIAARAPERHLAKRETVMVLVYAALGQAAGGVLGPALGYRPFSFHIAGTLVGSSTPPSSGEITTWALFSFVVYALVPFLWFRRRYTSTQLNLRSTDRKNDLLVILVVGAIEAGVELGTFPGFFKLTASQLLIGGPLAFVLFMLGTVLPTMVIIHVILVPRYLKLTGSVATTVLLGGITYAGMHIVEGWQVFRSPDTAALSLIFVVLQYTGPGMVKTFMTLRTGNAWVHAFGYHAFAPHVVVDTPLVVHAFGIQ
jgi:hypothetical protein